MRALLVHATHGAAGERRIDAGLALARACGGHLTAHINMPATAFVAMDPFGGAHIMGDVMKQATERRDALVTALDARLTRDDVPWSIETSEADPVDALVSAARLQDLVIMGLGDPATSLATRPPVGAVAVGARCPVLALPDAGVFDPGGVAMVAWNGSHEAANALRAAVPLLRLAAAVHVVTVRDDAVGAGGGFPAEDALTYLSRHGVHAEASESERGLETVEEALTRIAGALGASLLVMGAYGHSRLRETLFGGVTRFAIDTSERALLLAH